MKLRAWAPAIAGLVALLSIVAIVMLRGERDDETPTRVSTAAPAKLPARTTERPVVATTPDEATDDDLAHKRPLTPDELKVGTPDTQPKKAKMTLDERLAEAQKHVPVIERRAELLDQEIAKLEAAGKTQEAAEQRIVAARLRAHADELRKAIAEHREPM